MSRTMLTASVLVSLLVASRLLTAQAAPGSGHWEGSFSGPNGEVAVQRPDRHRGAGAAGRCQAGDLQAVHEGHELVLADGVDPQPPLRQPRGVAPEVTPVGVDGGGGPTALDGQRVHDRGIVYAPDYVINAGGIINVALEYLGQGNREEVESRIHQIPGRLAEIWAESKASGTPASVVADRMAQKLIGRG